MSDVKNRVGRIGSSDVAAILGLSPYRTPYETWEVITGRTPPFEGNEHTRRGEIMESAIAQLYKERTGQHLEVRPSGWTHPKYPYMVAHPDFVDIGGRLVEIKCPRRMDAWGKEGTDDIPDEYYCQVLFQLALGMLEEALDEEAHVVPFCGEMFIYPVHYKSGLADDVIQRLAAWFEQYVTKDEPPPPQNEADCQKRWQVVKGKTVEADGNTVLLVQRYRELQQQKKEIEGEMSDLKTQVLTVMQDASSMVYDGKSIVSHSEVVQRRLNTTLLQAERPDLCEKYTTESSYRRFAVR